MIRARRCHVQGSAGEPSTSRPHLSVAAATPFALVLVAVASGCAGPRTVPRAPFWPRRVGVSAPARVLFRSPDAPGATGTHHYEYVFPDRAIAVYDIDHSHQLVERVSIPEAHGFRGIAVSPKTGMLYMSVGGNGGTSGTGSLISYDLIRNRIVWERAFPTGTDSPAITPDGRTIFLPTGERTTDRVWYVVVARTGQVVHEIDAGPGPTQHDRLAERATRIPRAAKLPLPLRRLRTHRSHHPNNRTAPRRRPPVHNRRAPEARLHDSNRISRLPGLEHPHRASPLHRSDPRHTRSSLPGRAEPRHLPLSRRPQPLRDRHPEQLCPRL